MSNPSDKYRTFIELLYTKTSQGSVNWEKNDSFEGTYGAKIGSKQVFIERTEDENENPLIITEIYSVDGLIDSFNDEAFRGLVPAVGGFQNYFKMMKEIHELARRKATGVDAALDELIENLKTP